LFGIAGLLAAMMIAAAVGIDRSSFDALPLTVPFWIAGGVFFMLAAWETHSVRWARISESGVVLGRRFAFFNRVKRFRRNDAQCARRQDPMSLMSQFNRPDPVKGVEIVYRKGAFLLPVTSDAEANWIIQLLNDRLRRDSIDATSDEDQG
jgi:hypothetical protein